jgi:hypothetical protein
MIDQQYWTHVPYEWDHCRFDRQPPATPADIESNCRDNTTKAHKASPIEKTSKKAIISRAVLIRSVCTSAQRWFELATASGGQCALFPSLQTHAH